MATYRPVQIHDKIVELIDTILTEQDPVKRVAMFAYAQREWRTLILPARNKATYDARLLFSGKDISALADVDHREVYRWSAIHAERYGEPSPPRIPRVDISGAVRIET